MNTNPDTQLVLNPALRIIRSTNDEIIVRFGSRGRSSRRISDTKRRGILSDIVFGFNERTSLDDVCKRFGEAGRELLLGLLEGNVIIPESDLAFGFLAAGYGITDPEISSLTVIGEGRFAAECTRLLHDALGEKITISEQSKIKVDVEPADFTVCVSDSPNTAFFYDVNEYALSYGAIWHGGYLDGPEVIVGPLFVPGETGCFHDFDVMEEAGRSMMIDHLYMKMNGASAIPTQVPAFVPSLAASYLTSSVIQHVLGVGSHLEGEFLRIDLDRLEIIRQRATRLARCPACTENRPDIRNPFL